MNKSIEFVIWFSRKKTSPEQASRIHAQLSEGDTSVVEPNDAIADFVRELTKRYPQIHECPDDKPELCPWTSPFHVSAGHVLIRLSATHRWAGEAYETLRDLAARYGLTLFKPQSHMVHTPSALRRIWNHAGHRLKPWQHHIVAGLLLAIVGALIFVAMRFLWSLLGLGRLH